MVNKDLVKRCEIFALKIRIETLKALANLGFGHVGGAMSIADTVAVLYEGVMNIDPKNPNWQDRDWLICSKGHGGPAIYSALALKRYFPVEDLLTLNKPGTNLPSHCDRNLTIGVDMTTGSLGQGASTAVGVALGNKMDKRENTTYLILGDGELQEGQVWEAAMFASQQKLDNLIAFVDNNKQQLDGYTKDINDLLDIKKKFESFGWQAFQVDGANVEDIIEAIENAKLSKGKPSVIVLDTIKGKGCSFAEGVLDNHHMVVKKDEADKAIEILNEALRKKTLEKQGACGVMSK